MATGAPHRIYTIVFDQEARQVMADWPPEIRASLQQRIEQLAELPVDAHGENVRSVLRDGAAGEFSLEIELQPAQSRLVVRTR